MKVAVIGSRSFHNYEMLKNVLSKYHISLIISGGAKGADSLAETYARENDIETLIFKPDWDKHGKSAGYIRNIDIIENSDLVIAFWDGKSKGTKHSIDLAKKGNKKIIIERIENAIN